MTTSKGMINVAGVTYRIVEESRLHRVVRLLDDRAVGSFRHGPCLAVVESTIGAEALLDVAHTALQSGLVRWRTSDAAGCLRRWVQNLNGRFVGKIPTTIARLARTGVGAFISRLRISVEASR